MTRLIDTMHLGHDRVIGAYEVGEGVTVDPGPAYTAETFLDIHLDHAGATGPAARHRSREVERLGTVDGPGGQIELVREWLGFDRHRRKRAEREQAA